MPAAPHPPPGERGDTSATGGPVADIDRDPTSGDTAEITAATSPAGSTGTGGSCDRCGAAPSSARPAFLVVADLATLDPDDPTGSGTARLLWATARVPVIRNGPTALENLALLCRDHHHAIHDSGWHVTLAADGSMAFNRRGVALTSQPQFRQHPRATVTTPTGRPRRRRPRSTDPEPGADAGRAPDLAVAVGRSGRDPAAALLPF